MQSLRQQLHMLLWLDEWEPLNPARCWSECIRRDLQTFVGERRVKWRTIETYPWQRSSAHARWLGTPGGAAAFRRWHGRFS
jgi:hypothetical protein